MTKEEYLERLGDNTFKDFIVPIFDFFEKYLDNDNTQAPDHIDTIQNNMKTQEIRHKIALLLGKLYREKRRMLIYFCWSLLTNVHQFEKMDNEVDNDKRMKKWKKCGYSYINLSRNLTYDLQIQEQLQKKPEHQKIVLCASMVILEEDDIRVNEEIDNIQVHSKSSTYLVIAIHGCSFDQFKNRIRKNHITHIHIAGHANDTQLEFSDAPVRYKRFCNHIQQLNFHCELLFLNCCKTYEYLQKKSFPHSDNSICHEDDLIPTTALDASYIFYANLFSGLSINDSWNGINNSLGVNNNYCFL